MPRTDTRGIALSRAASSISHVNRIHPAMNNMVNDKELAALVARDLFEIFDNAGDKCQRIQGKGGDYTVKETDLGGLCEESLAGAIEHSLAKHRSY